DNGWRASDHPLSDWHQPDFDDSSWPAAQELGPNGMAPWGVKRAEPATDVYAAFRGAFELDANAEVTVKIIGAHWFQARLDERFLTEGPARFPISHPEYEIIRRRLQAGPHVIAAVVHDEGVSTRMLRSDLIDPFLLCKVSVEGRPVDVRWRCRRLPGYLASGVRMSPQFGWIEWVDSRANPTGWQAIGFDDGAWPSPVDAPASRWTMRPLSTGPVKQFVHRPKRIGGGVLTGPFESSEIPDWPEEGDVSWYRRNLAPKEAPEGVWRRYDLGRVRLGRPSLCSTCRAGRWSSLPMPKRWSTATSSTATPARPWFGRLATKPPARVG
ncbi:hypothetical protein ACFL5Q_08020, partial [Planctomycetota bacterium]